MLGSTAATPVEVWFQHEARVGQKGGHTYLWARLAKGSDRRSRMEWQGEGKVGSRPPMIRDNRHDSAYIFGAICPDRAVGAAIIAPAANTECMNLHLQEISTQVAPGAIAGLVCDSAGWHQTGGELTVPDNIVLLPLPPPSRARSPYSPELNPMENVWQYLRSNKLCATAWDSYEAIVEACADAWNWFVNDPDRIRSIGTRGWATVNV